MTPGGQPGSRVTQPQEPVWRPGKGRVALASGAPAGGAGQMGLAGSLMRGRPSVRPGAGQCCSLNVPTPGPRRGQEPESAISVFNGYRASHTQARCLGSDLVESSNVDTLHLRRKEVNGHTGPSFPKTHPLSPPARPGVHLGAWPLTCSSNLVISSSSRSVPTLSSSTTHWICSLRMP